MSDVPVCIERLQELLHYDPENGLFTWRVTRKKCPIGKRAGTQRKDGYRLICIDGVSYLEGRLAWLYMTGEWPAHEVDHRNLDPSDTAWDNLRAATRGQNECNKPLRSSNCSGCKGVRRANQKSGYEAYLCRNNKHITLGTHPTVEAASLVRKIAAIAIYGEFARHE
jgi:HNH endonuclease